MPHASQARFVREQLGNQVADLIAQLEPQLLLQLIPETMLGNLSFYNFRNAITACYFADRNLKLRHCNEQFCSLCGKDNLEGQPLTEVFAGLGLSQEVIASFTTQLTRQKWVKLPQVELVVKGATQYFSLFSTFTEYEGIPALNGVQGQLIDRTQEVLLRKRQEQIAGQIRHDMKNRIAATLMGSDALLGELETLQSQLTFPETAQPFLENLVETLKEMHANSDYLSYLILQMLDISKLQSGQLRLKLNRFSIREALNQALKALRQQQEAHQLAVTVTGADVEVEADFVQLSRVIENYHSNALKYAKNRVDWTIRHDHETLWLSVRDDGEGIPSEYLERIFEPFFQVPGKEKPASTGLGLDSVRELVKLHQGKTWAESAGTGQGSCFVLQIPLKSVLGR